MDFTHFVFDEKYLSAIGWTLAHAIWQIALVGGILWVVLRTMSRAGAQHRYAAGLSALIFIVLLSSWTFLDQLSHVSSRQQEQTLASAEWGQHASEVFLIPTANVAVVKPHFTLVYWMGKMESLLPYLVNLWMLGVLFYTVKLSGSFYDLQKLHRKHHESVSRDLLKKVDSLSAALGLYRKVQVLKSTLVRTPVTYGCLKPVILLPPSLVFSINPAQMEAIIAHELAHIKRNDYLIHLFQSVLEVLFFFHPCFWWISQVVNEERENAADDLALAAGISSYDLAHGLAEVANHSSSPAPDMALAASGNKHTTLQRIKRILGKQTSDPKLSPLIPITMILAIITASALMVGAQDQGTKATEATLLTEISHHVVNYNRPLPKVMVIKNEVAQQDTLPAKPLPKAPGQEDMPVLNLTATPQLDMDVPPMPEPPPAPPVPLVDFDFPQLDIHIEADSLANMAMKLHALNGDDSPEGKKKRKALEAAMDRVQANITTLSKGFEEKMAQWEASHGDSFKQYEEEMRVWGEKMKEHQESWEATFAPKMEDFEKKMKLWEEENAPKLKEFEEKMKQWLEENEEKFQWQEGKAPVPF